MYLIRFIIKCLHVSTSDYKLGYTFKGENFPLNKKRLDINYIDHEQGKGNKYDIALLKGTLTKKHT